MLIISVRDEADSRNISKHESPDLSCDLFVQNHPGLMMSECCVSVVYVLLCFVVWWLFRWVKLYHRDQVTKSL